MVKFTHASKCPMANGGSLRIYPMLLRIAMYTITILPMKLFTDVYTLGMILQALALPDAISLQMLSGPL